MLKVTIQMMVTTMQRPPTIAGAEGLVSGPHVDHVQVLVDDGGVEEAESAALCDGCGLPIRCQLRDRPEQHFLGPMGFGARLDCSARHLVEDGGVVLFAALAFARCGQNVLCLLRVAGSIAEALALRLV